MRRRRTTKVAQPVPLPLFEYAARQQQHRPTAHPPRLMLRHDLRDANGEPRACILIPGRPVPLVFRNISAAAAALRQMEGAAR